MATKDPAAAELAAKTRIITHMNNDHQDSLVRYLEAYHNLSSFTARNAKIARPPRPAPTPRCPANSSRPTPPLPTSP